MPTVWREAIWIPVFRRGKDKSKAESYRPISLISCMGKLMERLINTRLMWHLEDKKHITPKQAAFRQDRSVKGQITYISQAIEDVFQDKRPSDSCWTYHQWELNRWLSKSKQSTTTDKYSRYQYRSTAWQG